MSDNGKTPLPVRRDTLGRLIEQHERAMLSLNGSFMGSDIFEAVLQKNRNFRTAIRRMEKTFPEFDVATAYEQYVRIRILRIAKEIGCVSVPVNGLDYIDKVRWVLRDQSSSDILEKSAKAKYAFADRVFNSSQNDLDDADRLRITGAKSLSALRLTDGK